MRWRGGRGEITQSDEKGDHRAHPAMPTPRQTAWFIIIAGEESGVYEGMRWDGTRGQSRSWAISSVHPMSPRCMDPTIKRMGTDSDIDVGVETCRVMIRGGEGPILVPSPSCSSCLSGEL